MQSTVRIQNKILSDFLEALFRKAGVNKCFYSPVVVELIKSSLRGVDSHGIRLAPHYIKALLIGRINKEPKFKFKKKSLSVGVLDADHGFGIAAGLEAVHFAVKMAKKTGVGVVAVKNSTHFGAAEIFSLAAADKNMVGISLSNTDALVIPFGGRVPFLGTNPIAIAFPCLGGPISLDMATSSVAWNKIMVYRAQNKKLEPGWAVDEKANPVVDSKLAKWLVAFGGYKGYGLGLTVGIFSALFTGMPFDNNIVPMSPLNNKRRKLGHFFIVIDISKFLKIGTFKKRVYQVTKELRLQKAADGFKQVIVAGDDRKNECKLRLKNGIPMSEQLIQEFNELAIRFKIKKLY